MRLHSLSRHRTACFGLDLRRGARLCGRTEAYLRPLLRMFRVFRSSSSSHCVTLSLPSGRRFHQRCILSAACWHMAWRLYGRVRFATDVAAGSVADDGDAVGTLGMQRILAARDGSAGVLDCAGATGAGGREDFGCVGRRGGWANGGVRTASCGRLALCCVLVIVRGRCAGRPHRLPAGRTPAALAAGGRDMLAETRRAHLAADAALPTTACRVVQRGVLAGPGDVTTARRHAAPRASAAWHQYNALHCGRTARTAVDAARERPAAELCVQSLGQTCLGWHLHLGTGWQAERRQASNSACPLHAACLTTITPHIWHLPLHGPLSGTWKKIRHRGRLTGCGGGLGHCSRACRLSTHSRI